MVVAFLTINTCFLHCGRCTTQTPYSEAFNLPILSYLALFWGLCPASCILPCLLPLLISVFSHQYFHHKWHDGTGRIQQQNTYTYVTQQMDTLILCGSFYCYLLLYMAVPLQHLHPRGFVNMVTSKTVGYLPQIPTQSQPWSWAIGTDLAHNPWAPCIHADDIQEVILAESNLPNFNLPNTIHSFLEPICQVLFQQNFPAL